MLLALPLVMIILFGFGITTEIKNSKIAIYDPSKDIATQGIIDRLKTSEYFTLAEYLQNPNDIEPIFKEGKVSLAIVFGERFYENLLHTGEAQVLLIADGSDPNHRGPRHLGSTRWPQHHGTLPARRLCRHGRNDSTVRDVFKQ